MSFLSSRERKQRPGSSPAGVVFACKGLPDHTPGNPESVLPGLWTGRMGFIH